MRECEEASRQLIERSREAYLLSLDVYNKPILKYRVEGFCFFFCNAWELLLKAKILEDTKNERSIFYPKKRGKPRRSLSLKDALKKVFPNQNDPIRRNVEEIAILRDVATHLIIPELESIYAGIFQAGVLNYATRLEEWFGLSLKDMVSPAMMSLVFDVKQLDPVAVQKRYGREALEFIARKSRDLEEAGRELRDTRFCVSIEYKLALVKKPKNADIVLMPGPEGEYEGLLIEVPKDIGRTHPHLAKDVIARVRQQVGEIPGWNTYGLQAVLEKEKIRRVESSNFYYHITRPEVHRYSDALIKLIARKIKNDPSYLQRARESYSAKRRGLSK